MLFSCGHAISQIRKIFFSFSSSVKSTLFDAFVFLKLNSRSPTLVLHCHSPAYTLHHLCFYHFKSFSSKLKRKLNFFVLEITNVINALVMPAQILAICLHFSFTKDFLPLPFVGHTVWIYNI